MLKAIFEIKKSYFIIVYFAFVFLDLWVKLNLEIFPYRYFTKPIIMILLIIFYLKNQKLKRGKNYNYTLLALICFTVASVAVINHLNDIMFSLGMLFFILGKILFCLRFTNYRDFSIVKLFPFFVGCFILMFSVFYLIYNGLGKFFIPVLIYFFVSLLLSLFAYLRKNDVNNKSYRVVILSMIFLLLSEINMGIKTYYTPLPFEDISVMLFYAIGVYLIVYGILIEVKIKEKLV
ncbi:hypothetical protein BWR22_05710 [Lacinutrix venerupis]|uniref:YhhN-like protein n=1 Tax=Lacinutrix venerupis TaxID=1486034 RepID=A0AAC9LM14_9FLAO|nr:hypothetical protein BWR22_05710 [Lacinutrix venerupis]